jgi:hypothetical protein
MDNLMWSGDPPGRTEGAFLKIVAEKLQIAGRRNILSGNAKTVFHL